MLEENLIDEAEQPGRFHGDNKQTRVVAALTVCNGGKLTGTIHNAALLFLRILFWHSEVKFAHARLVIDGDDPNNLAHRWVMNTKELWGRECHLSVKQVRRALHFLEKVHAINRRTGVDKNGSVLHVQPTAAMAKVAGARLPKGVYWP